MTAWTSKEKGLKGSLDTGVWRGHWVEENFDPSCSSELGLFKKTPSCEGAAKELVPPGQSRT